MLVAIMSSDEQLLQRGIELRGDYGRLLGESASQIAAITRAVIDALQNGHRILTCGNGGSAAESLHFAEELVGRFRAERRPLPALSLVADSTALTCIGNDYGFDEIFARQVDGLGTVGDVLICLSTSGKSPNLIKALRRAKDKKLTTVGLLGRPGSPSEAHCDLAFTPETDSSALVQELHLAVIHLVLEAVDAAFVE